MSSSALPVPAQPHEARLQALARLGRAPVLGLISLYVVENNGVRFISSILRENGHEVVEVYLKDYCHARFEWPSEREIQLLVDVLRSRRVDLVGISLRAGGYFKLSCALTRRLHDELGVPVMWGGMHVTMSPEQCIPHADMLVVGEAERVMVDLLDGVRTGVDLATLPSLWLHQDGGVIRNPVRPLEENLDSLPFRDFHSHPDKFWINGGRVTQGDPYVSQTCYLMLSARGCLFDCSFCDISALRKVYEGKGRFYRAMSPAQVVEECRYARRTFRNLRRIRFDDELFMMSQEWVDEFCRLYPVEVGLPFEILTDPRVVREDRLRQLQAAGMDTAMMGIQNIERINRTLYNRPVTDGKVLEAAWVFKRLGMRPCYQVIVDDPVSTSQDKRDFFDFVATLPRPYDLYLFSLAYWPSTALTERLLQEGVITPEDVEGENDKCMYQFRADLSWPRPPEDVFWLSLLTLLSKDFIPISFVRWLSRRHWLKRHPRPLYALAQTCNFLKLGWLAAGMLFRRELTVSAVRRWLNWKSLATT